MGKESVERVQPTIKNREGSKVSSRALSSSSAASLFHSFLLASLQRCSAHLHCAPSHLRSSITKNNQQSYEEIEYGRLRCARMRDKKSFDINKHIRDLTDTYYPTGSINRQWNFEVFSKVIKIYRVQ